jgi:hypothetical protein
MSWTEEHGVIKHVCDRCGGEPSTANPFGQWVVVLFPKENAKHFCLACTEALRVALDAAMAG